MKKSIILFLLLFLNYGCAFVGYGGIGEAEFKSRDQKEPIYRYTTITPDLKRKYKMARKDSKPFRVTDILKEWGEPDDIIILNDQTKKYIYKKGLRWKGVMIIIGVPLPIAVPVGMKTITFTFENEMLLNWAIHDNHYCASIVGFNLIPIDPEGHTAGIIAETSCKIPKYANSYDITCDVPLYDKCH